MRRRAPGRPVGRYTQAARARRVEALLWASGRVSIVDIALDLGVSDRTVRRDLAALREAGLGVRVEGCHASLTREGIAADPRVQAIARHLRAEGVRSASEGEPAAVRFALWEIALGIARGEIRFTTESAEAAP